MSTDLESGANKFRRVTQNEGKFKNAKAVLAGIEEKLAYLQPS